MTLFLSRLVECQKVFPETGTEELQCRWLHIYLEYYYSVSPLITVILSCMTGYNTRQIYLMIYITWNTSHSKAHCT